MALDKGLTLELTADVPLPRARVFGLLTDPAELPLWWGPHGFTTPEIELDLRVGGGYRFTMQPPEGEPFHLSGTFTSVEPATVAYTFMWEEPAPDDVETHVTLSLRPVDTGTRIHLLHRGFSTEERVALHRGGWSDGFERMLAIR
ncbi:MAG TPA: SRPBCC domain-containing protein [Nocardioidaceae bacterium]|nr:SRPBCC domain-containing protein [Nocardioidaceae bacterium]